MATAFRSYEEYKVHTSFGACPNCGNQSSKPHMELTLYPNVRKKYSLVCEMCGRKTEPCKPESEAIKKWNYKEV